MMLTVDCGKQKFGCSDALCIVRYFRVFPELCNTYSFTSNRRCYLLLTVCCNTGDISNVLFIKETR